jgi:signal transduction histidine kinase
MEAKLSCRELGLTINYLNVVLFSLKLFTMLLDKCLGKEVYLFSFAYLLVIDILAICLYYIYNKRLVSGQTALNLAIELDCAAFLFLGFVHEPSLMLIWVIGYNYMVLLLQAPNVPSSYRMAVYLKPVICIPVAGIAGGHFSLTSHNEAFAVVVILMFGYISAVVQSHERHKEQGLLKDLHETKEMLDAIIAAVPAGLVVISAEGRAVKSNSATDRKLRCSTAEAFAKLSEVPYKAGTRHFSLEDNSLTADIMHYLQSEQSSQLNFGQVQVFERVLEVVGNKTTLKGANAVVIALKDLTDVILLEHTQNESQFKNVMLRSVSHELKTPTNVILHSVQSVASGEDVPQWAKQKLEVAEVSCKHLLMLIYDLLDFSQLIAGRFSLQKGLFNLRRVLKDTLDLMQFCRRAEGYHPDLERRPAVA